MHWDMSSWSMTMEIHWPHLGSDLYDGAATTASAVAVLVFFALKRRIPFPLASDTSPVCSGFSTGIQILAPGHSLYCFLSNM